jgi:serine/threonine protein phosphatase PrpC
VAKTQNQDTYFALEKEHCWVLGVCDGHGTNGHLVSTFLKNFLPEALLGFIPQQKLAESSILNTALTRAYDTCEQQLRDSAIDISNSGSTCVTVLVLNHTIACANVGDSRAVLGRKTHGMWSVFQLSWDHKPEDPPEHSRIIAAGGEITVSKLARSGPSRVYVKGESFPGLAMSRSMGDSVASTVGVISDPDIVTAPVNSTDKFLLLASDGLWSVISSVEAVHKIGVLMDAGKEDSACSVLIREAQTRWLKQGVIVDDITVVIAFFNP